MGKLYTAIMPDGTERFAADFSMGRAALFYDLSLLLEKYVGLPCGISPDTGLDEHLVDPSLFVPFFERVWLEEWLADAHGGFLRGWAAHAAGMVENITLKPRRWVDRSGTVLPVQRYQRPNEISERLP